MYYEILHIIMMDLPGSTEETAGPTVSTEMSQRQLLFFFYIFTLYGFHAEVPDLGSQDTL